MNLKDIFGNKTEAEGDARPSYMSDEIYVRVNNIVHRVNVPDDTEDAEECECHDDNT